MLYFGVSKLQKLTKSKNMPDKIFLEALEVPCIIGIFDWERKVKQKVLIDFEMPTNVAKAARKDDIKATVNYKAIAKATIKFISESDFFLVETLAEKVAQMILKEFKLSYIKLRVSKPGAIRGAKNVGIEIVRKAKKKEARKALADEKENLRTKFRFEYCS
jgi:dihydroneopterin aldolase